MVGGAVIVGAGQAGARTALALREQGWPGAITLVGDEAHLPYERPPLSKAVLLGRAEPHDSPVAPADAYVRAGVAPRLGAPVVALDLDAREVWLSSGERLAFDRLILATGVRPRRLACPGAGLAGVVGLRTREDALALRARLAAARAMVVVGGGFIGLEAAAAARTLGVEVTVLEREAACLARVLPEPSVVPLIALHEAHGVRFRCAETVEAILGEEAAVGVQLVSGEALEADVVLVGVGSAPDLGLARAAGLECRQGVRVDAQGATSAPGVYAVGDLAETDDPSTGAPTRLESWQAAESQAVATARAIMGLPPEPVAPPWFWTDQYDWNVQVVGAPRCGDTLHHREGADTRRFCHLYTREDRLVGAVMFNSGRERRTLSALIAQARAIHPSALSDSTFDLRRVA